MTETKRRYSDDVPDDVTARLRRMCLALPDAYEEPAWVGTRWMVRRKTFAHVLGVQSGAGAPSTVLAFRADGEDLEALRQAGHPFLVLGWGRSAIGIVLDLDTDWEEVRELVTESFCVMAPKKLAALVRPITEVASGPDRE